MAVRSDLTAGVETTGQGADGQNLIFTAYACSDRASPAGEALARRGDPPLVTALREDMLIIVKCLDTAADGPLAGSSASGSNVRVAR